MTCPRCQGALVREHVVTVLYQPVALRCINCGWIAWLEGWDRLEEGTVVMT